MTQIRTKPATDQYREGWDRVFGKPFHCPRCGYEAQATVCTKCFWAKPAE